MLHRVIIDMVKCANENKNRWIYACAKVEIPLAVGLHEAVPQPIDDDGVCKGEWVPPHKNNKFISYAQSRLV